VNVVSRSGHCLLGLYALVAMLAGCGGSEQPINALSTTSQNSEIPKAKGKDFVYVGASLGGTVGSHEAAVEVFSYPKLTFLGTWVDYSDPYGNNGTTGLCSDTAGNVFALLYQGKVNEIIEFAHGGVSPINTLLDPDGIPLACSVDPMTGNLAVVNAYYTNSPGVLLIYRAASGSPTTYSDPNLEFYNAGYDGKGNLFLDGKRRSQGFGLAELASGGGSFKNINLEKALKSAGIVQWDGAYMTVSDGHVIDRFTVKGERGTIVGSTRLRKPHDPCGSLNCFYGFSPAWIQGDVVVGDVSWCLLGVPCSGNVGLWHYPRGGRPFRTISPYLTYVPSGLTVSLAPK
jgi:hypothetical protein